MELVLGIQNVMKTPWPRIAKDVYILFLRQCETHSQCVSLASLREPLKLSLLDSILNTRSFGSLNKLR